MLCKQILIFNMRWKRCYFVTEGVSRAREWSMANVCLFVFNHLPSRRIVSRSSKYKVWMRKKLYKTYKYGENKRKHQSTVYGRPKYSLTVDLKWKQKWSRPIFIIMIIIYQNLLYISFFVMKVTEDKFILSCLIIVIDYWFYSEYNRIWLTESTTKTRHKTGI